MSKSKDKGTRFENWLADHLTEANIPSERVPLSGSLGGKYGTDVVIGTPDKPESMIECKNRENISKQLWEWLAGDDFLAIKRNYKTPLIVMEVDDFIALVKGHHKCQEKRPRVRQRTRKS